MFHFWNQQYGSGVPDFATFIENIAPMISQEITPLHVACGEGDLRKVKFFLDQGTDINVTGKRNWTPLYCAVLFDHLNIAKYLVQNGADINATDVDGWNVLAYACHNDKFPAIIYLVNNGADVNIKSKNWDSLLHIASKNGNVKLIDYLVRKGVSVNDGNQLDEKPIHAACYAGHYKAVEALIRHSSDFNAGCKVVSERGECVDRNVTPLFLSASRGHLELVKYFIKLKVDMNTKTWKENTPLHTACRYGAIEVVKLLLQNHADVNAGDVHNITPLHCAASENHVNIVACLLKHPGIEIDVKTLNDLTALHIAVFEGNVEIVKLLIESGADINVVDRNGDTPSSLALKCNHLEIFSLLSNIKKVIKTPSNVSSTPDSIMFKAVGDNDITNLLNAINQGADVNTKSNKCNSPLILAAWKGFYDIIQILIKHDADVNLTGKNNCSALHYAAKYNHIDIVHYLLQHGAIYNIPTAKENKIPCDFACQDSQVFVLLKLIDKCFDDVINGNKDIIEDLLEIKNNNLNDFNSITQACNADGKTLIQLNNDLLTKHDEIAKSFTKLSVGVEL